MAEGIPFCLLGLQISGDVGPWTIYSDRFGKPIVFPRSPPKVPRSERQAAQRQRWRDCCDAWNALDQAERDAYETLSLRASMCMTGFNLFLKMSMNPDYSTWSLLFEQTGLTYFAPPAYVPLVFP
jgi:hypothetical protein